MKFTFINPTIIAAACDESAKVLRAAKDMGFIELFSVEGIRTLKQNSKMWPALTDISKHVVWRGEKHDPETWKHIISAAWRDQVFVHGIGDNMVVIPVSTRRLRKSEFAELLTAIHAFGDEQGVPWSDPAIQAYQAYAEAA